MNDAIDGGLREDGGDGLWEALRPWTTAIRIRLRRAPQRPFGAAFLTSAPRSSRCMRAA